MGDEEPVARRPSSPLTGTTSQPKGSEPIDNKSDGRGDPSDITSELLEVSFSARFSGPLPPPSLLRAYADVLPDAPERLLRMVEAQSNHRRKLEEKSLSATAAQIKLGQWLAFVLVMISLVGATIVLCTVQSWPSAIAAGILGASGMPALAAVFIWGARRAGDKKDSESSSPNGPSTASPRETQSKK